MAQKVFNFPFVDNYNESSGPFISFRPGCCCGDSGNGSGDSGSVGDNGGMTEEEVQKLISDLLSEKELGFNYNEETKEYELTVGGEVKGVITMPEDKHISGIRLVDGQLEVTVDGLGENLTVDFSKFVTNEDVEKALDKLKDGVSERYDTLKEVEDGINELKAEMADKVSEETVDDKIKEALKGIEVIEPDLSDYAKKDELPDMTDYVKKDELPTYSEPDLSNYVTKEELPDPNDFVNPKELEDYVKKSELEIPEIPDHSDYVKRDELTDLLTPFATVKDVDKQLLEKQKAGNYIEYKDENGRKVITFNNADIIGARANTDALDNKYPATGWISLIQLNKWNVVDIGSPKTITNINTPKGEHPTVQEAGQSGAEAYHIAYLEDLPDTSVFYSKEEIDNKGYVSTSDVKNIIADGGYADTQNDIRVLKGIIKNILGGGNNKATTFDDINKADGDLLVSGKIVGDPTRAATTKYKVTDGDLTLYDYTVQDVSLELTALNGDLTIEEMRSSGVLTVAGAKNNITLYCNGDVSIRNCAFEQECYNGIFMNNNGTAKSTNVLVEHVDIAKTNNNAILILATADDAVIDIKDVTMGEVKNAVRLSNYTKAKGVAVNLENIEVATAREKFILLEDYITRKAGSGLADDNTDLFKDMVFNIRNCRCNGNLITADTPISDFVQMVVGKPSLGADIPVTYEEHPESFPTFNFE